MIDNPGHPKGSLVAKLPGDATNIGGNPEGDASFVSAWNPASDTFTFQVMFAGGGTTNLEVTKGAVNAAEFGRVVYQGLVEAKAGQRNVNLRRIERGPGSGYPYELHFTGLEEGKTTIITFRDGHTPSARSVSSAP